MSAAKTHWDPIYGTVEVETPDITTIRKGIEVPRAIMRLLSIAAIVSILGVIVEGFITGEFPFLSTAITTVIWVIFLGLTNLENVSGRETIRRVRLAEKNGWSYTGTMMERVRKFQTVYGSDGADRTTRLEKSERALAVEAKVPELTKVRFGAFIGAQFDGEFWGESLKDSLPLWLAIGSMQMEAGLAFNSQLRRDAFGGKGGSGRFFSLLGAYKIDRKTGVRIVVMPENIGNTGPLDRDIKTESVAFNNAFHISGRFIGDSGNNGDPSLEILRVLTPATQDTMLSMLDRYHNIGFVLEDDVLFFMAQDKLVGKNAEPDRIDALLASIAADFEEAKFSLKRYVE